MVERFTITLANAANDMAQEEIGKQVAFLSKDVRNVRFEAGGRSLAFDAPAAVGPQLTSQARVLAEKIQRSLRTLERKVLFRSSQVANPNFRGGDVAAGVHFMGKGQVALQGIPLRLFRYFDRLFEQLGGAWNAEPLITPTLIPSRILSKCDYFRSFPHNVTFTCHLTEDPAKVDAFRSRHQSREDLDEAALADMDTPEACLSPAVCYHAYHLNQDSTVPSSGLVYGICGKCFRYESSNISDLRRLWDFTMREVVFLGSRDNVLKERSRSIEIMSELIEEHQLAAEIRTASDPFYIAPDAMAKTYFQLSSETKFEISLLLPGDERIAIGSHNYHSDFFGRAFNTQVEGAGAMHSVCVGFGLERWVHGFLTQHGSNVEDWPAVVRNAPEFRGS
jgi:seryl-tRNA synthetase